ncbi:MAG: hypothetical protein ACRD4Q_11470 [Candidatus Acidiferrales bacterium]
MKKIALAISLATALAAGVYGQAGGSPPSVGHFQARYHGRSFAFHRWKLVTGEPYSATVSEQHTRTLANGTTISRSTTGEVARDSSGRTYVKQTIEGGFLNSGNGPKTVIFITDPVAGYSYMLNPAKNTAVRRQFREHRARNRSNRPMRRPRGNNPNRAVADLGTQTDASGLELQGKEVTRTIPAGAIGNSEPISSVTQTWYSPALQIVVRSTRNDPRSGKSTYTLTNISRQEPDSNLFTVPAGFTVKDARQWRRDRRQR